MSDTPTPNMVEVVAHDLFFSELLQNFDKLMRDEIMLLLKSNNNDYFHLLLLTSGQRMIHMFMDVAKHHPEVKVTLPKNLEELKAANNILIEACKANLGAYAEFYALHSKTKGN